MAEAKKSKKGEAEFLDFCHLPRSERLRLARHAAKGERTVGVPISQVTTEQVLAVEPLSLFQHIACIVFLAVGVPNGVFTVPALTFLVGRFVLHNVQLAFIVLFILLLPLILLDQSFVPSRLNSWMAVQISRYFSFRFVIEQEPPVMTAAQNGDDKAQPQPQILVAPPHGVFPYGNILAMLLWPTLTGHHFRGLAANSALRVPLFKQVLKSIGVVDASRATATQALQTFPYTIGISTGGVAEIFETNDHNECVVLRVRIGMIKLAIRTGADLVPCYLFGNTKLLACWAGEGIPGASSLLQKISRKVGFGLIFIRGRFGLPIPYRIPVLGVLGKPIATAHIKCDEPTMEQVYAIQKLLLDEMQQLFDRYKALYGWEDKELIIK